MLATKPIGHLGRELGQPIGGFDGKSSPRSDAVSQIGQVKPGYLSGLSVRFYATMSAEKSQPNKGKPTLIVEGQAPLDVLVELLDLTIKEFCFRVGIDDRTYRRWKSRSTPPNLTLGQAKKLDLELQRIGLTIHDLPDVLCETKSA